MIGIKDSVVAQEDVVQRHVNFLKPHVPRLAMQNKADGSYVYEDVIFTAVGGVLGGILFIL